MNSRDKNSHDKDAWYLPLTLRSRRLADHAGQISLPGGALENREDDRQAALRELSEELGVSAAQYKLLGRLSPVYVFVSNFRITPWLAVADASLDLCPEPEEVDEILKVPLTHLVDERNHGRHFISRGSIQFDVPHIEWNGHRIWGATAMILGELVELLRTVPVKTM